MRTSLTPLTSFAPAPAHLPQSRGIEPALKPMLKPVLKYRGSKWRLAPWILAHFPDPASYTAYIEPYFGSGAVFFAKPPTKHEVINDLSGDVVNLFMVLRDHGMALAALAQMTPWARAEYEASFIPIPVSSLCDQRLEAARRFLVRCWQAQHLDFTRQTAWRHHGASTHSAVTGLWSQLPTRLLDVVDRLKYAEIECLPALEIIARNARPEVLLYVDPRMSLQHGDGDACTKAR